MKKICALVLALGLFVSLLPVQEAYGLGILDSVANLFGSDEKKDNEIPSMDDAFTGETIQVTVNGKKLEVHKNFYDAMTAYEEYFDKYIEIMQDDDVSVTETLSFLNQYTEMMAALEAIEDADMSKDEDVYYLHVMNSINEKLLAAS